jgi:hypothetical protein
MVNLIIFYFGIVFGTLKIIPLSIACLITAVIVVFIKAVPADD